LFDALRLIGGEEDLDAGTDASPALVIVAIIQLQFNCTVNQSVNRTNNRIESN